jgi:hypothetical protein
MKKYQLVEVFGTSRDVPKTYVVRDEIDGRFVNDLSGTKHIVLYGGSKQGKSCLRRHNLKPEDAFVVQCHRKSNKASIYEMILKQAGAKTLVSETRTISGDLKLVATVEAEGGDPLILEKRGKPRDTGTGDISRQTSKRTLELDPEDPNEVARVLNEMGLSRFIILEDFHYLEPGVQQALSFDLKVFHEVSNLVFIIVGIWLESNRLTLYNGDLSGRITNINTNFWTETSLREVLSAGENLLNIGFSDDVSRALLQGCQANVGVLQEACFRVCVAEEIWETSIERRIISNVSKVTEALVWTTDLRSEVAPIVRLL